MSFSISNTTIDKAAIVPVAQTPIFNASKLQNVAIAIATNDNKNQINLWENARKLWKS